MRKERPALGNSNFVVEPSWYLWTSVLERGNIGTCLFLLFVKSFCASLRRKNDLF